MQSKLNECEDKQLVAVEQEKAKLDCTSRQLEFQRHTNDSLKDVSFSVSFGIFPAELFKAVIMTCKRRSLLLFSFR